MGDPIRQVRVLFGALLVLLCFTDARLSVLRKPGGMLAAPAAVLAQHDRLHTVTLGFVPVVSSANRKHEQRLPAYRMHWFVVVCFFL